MRSIVLILLLASSVYGQVELSVKQLSVISIRAPEIFGEHVLAPEDVKLNKQSAMLIVAKGDYKSLDLEAESKPNFDLVDLIRDDKRPGEWLLIGSGKFRITAYAYDPEKGQSRKRIDVELGPPQPPGPGPGPQPPGPQDLPIEGEGLRVLVVYESAELSRLPEPQKQILTSTTIRQYLNSKCPTESGSYEYRFYDKDVDLSFVSERWRKAMAMPRDSIPWVLIANGKEGYSGPLPLNVGDMMTLIKKYGG